MIEVACLVIVLQYEDSRERFLRPFLVVFCTACGCRKNTGADEATIPLRNKCFTDSSFTAFKKAPH